MAEEKILAVMSNKERIFWEGGDDIFFAYAMEKSRPSAMEFSLTLRFLGDTQPP
ncbi:MAG: hypothetical protein ABH952_06400 [Candidatus Omnitrophota bacterium]